MTDQERMDACSHDRIVADETRMIRSSYPESLGEFGWDARCLECGEKGFIIYERDPAQWTIEPAMGVGEGVYRTRRSVPA